MYDRDELIRHALWSFVDEKPGIYELLDQDARAWWYHKKMRKEGQVSEARARERKSILDHVSQIRETLANGGYATISQSGGKFTMSMGDGCTLESYTPHVVLAAYLAGVPVVDFREVKDSVAIWQISMPVIGASQYPTNSKIRLADIEYDMERLGDEWPSHTSRVPLAEYFKQARAAGAAIHMFIGPHTKRDHYLIDHTEYPDWIASRRRDIQD